MTEAGVLRANLDGIGALMAATANVIMQLSRPPVGRGVVESAVESGQLTRHPLKRFRTTFTYLAVAMMGSEPERALYRRAVDRAHAAVRSGPGSPVAYNAFDPDLQLWVAACLYRGAVDVRTALRGPMDDADADAFYSEASRLATTLQVEASRWPPDRAAFEAYWQRQVAGIALDEEVRSYLWDVVRLRFLPWPVRAVQAPLHELLTAGFLPPAFRQLMGMDWTGSDERRFRRLLGLAAAANRPLPRAVQLFPLNACLWDMRLRIWTGRQLV